MRYLRLYNEDSVFQTEEQNAGGTGNAVESIVPGIVKTVDVRKMYFNPHDKEIQFHEITVNYKDSAGNILADSDTVIAKYIPGVSQEIVFVAKNVDGYVPRNTKITVNIPLESVVDFVYDTTYFIEPLTFNIISSGTITWMANKTAITRTIEYKKNNGEWVSITSNTGSSAPEILVSGGDKIQFRGNNAQYADNINSSYSYSYFGGSTAKFEAEGNIMSLIDSTGFTTAMTFSTSYTFAFLFWDCDGLLSAENLIMPSTVLTERCYYYMFRDCTSLTKAPLKIGEPTATIGIHCCNSMFQYCTSLITTPELPAMTLADNCYFCMFSNCTALTATPELPATTLAKSCYQDMFAGCKSLVISPSILPATALTNECYREMFSGCTSLTAAPILPATALTYMCYYYMFCGCSKLNSIKCLAKNISAGYCTEYWVNGVASSGTFVKNSDMSGWTTGYNGIPYGWSSNLKNNINIDKTTIGVYESGSSDSVVFESNIGSWTATTSDEWISISPSTGDCSSTTVTITAGQTNKERRGTVSFTDGFSIKNLSVIQNDKIVTPLTFEIISAGSISWVATDSSYTRAIEYKLNDNDWVSIRSDVAGSAPSISVVNGDVVKFRGNNSNYSSACTFFVNWCNKFSASTTCFNVRGNLMSLISKTDYINTKAFGKSAFVNLFAGCSGLISAERLFLPVDNLTDFCYQSMFANCTSLTGAPELPATTMAENCYYGMFNTCTSLTTPPILPAHKLAFQCYFGMFANCSSLLEAPILPARNVGQSSYALMFQRCTSLTTPPALPALKLSTSSYTGMFSYCTGLTTAPVLPATYLYQGCYGQMFLGCTSLTTAPELPATTLASNCYHLMFYDCTGLTYVKCLATNISATDCTSMWLNNVASAGTFVKDADMSGWTTGYNGIPAGWTVINRTNPSGIPLTFDILSSGTISWKATSDDIIRTIEYNVNNTGWVNLTATRAGTQFNVSAGDVVQFRGNNATYGYDVYDGYKFNCFCGSTATFNARGNIMSLINSTSYASLTELNSPDTFAMMFSKCEGLIDTSDLILPATTLKAFCYFGMFYDCPNLIKAPRILPATYLYGCDFCYSAMFQRCISLKETPILPAETLCYNCYGDMFASCYSLEISPNLPATYLYRGSECYRRMFYNCTSLTLAPELPATTLSAVCYEEMFAYCTSLKIAPELPATMLVDRCYSNMFYCCTNLNYIKCLATYISANNCTSNWVYNVAQNGKFIKNTNMNSWGTGVSGIPNNWTVEDAS